MVDYKALHGRGCAGRVVRVTCVMDGRNSRAEILSVFLLEGWAAWREEEYVYDLRHAKDSQRVYGTFN